MKNNKILTIVLVLVVLAGASLLLYPTVSNYWNSLHQSRAITQYTEQVSTLDEAQCEQLWKAAQDYNRTLLNKPDRFTMTDEERAKYDSLLNLSGTGVIGSIEIPAIHCSLPIYHGASESVLQSGVGHLEGSSLPTGGAGTHCVLSGHRGLPSSRLFTDLDKLVVGDTFTLNVLSNTLTYEVDQILVVDPYDMSALAIDPKQDYCTLVTCTPYGINTQRLLVRGHRIANPTAAQTATVAANAVQVNPAVVAPVVAAPILVVLLVCVLVRHRKHRGIPK